MIPKEVDALSWSQVRWFERLRNRGVVVEEGGRTDLKLEVFIDPTKIEAGPPPTGDFAAMARDSLQAYLPDVHDTGLFTMLADDAPDAIKARVTADPALLGKTVQVPLPVSPPYVTLAKGEMPKVVNPRFSERQIKAFDALVTKGLVHTPFNWELFFNADSRFPERAGLAGAITGTFYMLIVCFSLSFPIGIAAAVYLEEFAPKNRLTDLIEVNINNLAAVPSVVFGLLGLALFLGFFGLPRSTPLVGGMVLSLVTLPTIIIATRAALKAVPPSIREAALGVGASKHQVMLHHVLPLAMPGILTGTIREAVLHVVLGVAGSHGQVEPVERRCADPDSHLALGRLGHVQVGQRRNSVKVGHRESTHAESPWSSSCPTTDVAVAVQNGGPNRPPRADRAGRKILHPRQLLEQLLPGLGCLHLSGH